MKKSETLSTLIALSALVVSVLSFGQHRSEGETRMQAEVERDAFNRSQAQEARFQWASERISNELSHSQLSEHVNKGNEAIQNGSRIPNEYHQRFVAMAMAASDAWETGDANLQRRAHVGVAHFHRYLETQRDSVRKIFSQFGLSIKLFEKWSSDTTATSLTSHP